MQAYTDRGERLVPGQQRPLLQSGVRRDSLRSLEQTRIGPERAALVKQLNDTYVRGYYEVPLVNRGVGFRAA